MNEFISYGLNIQYSIVVRIDDVITVLTHKMYLGVFDYSTTFKFLRTMRVYDQVLCRYYRLLTFIIQ